MLLDSQSHESLTPATTALVVDWYDGVCGALIPANIVARIELRRNNFNPKPRVHLFQDMDNQPRPYAQGASAIFADGHIARKQVGHTVAYGAYAAAPETYLQLADENWAYGYEINGEDDRVYTDAFPARIALTEGTFNHGRELFNTNCATCHGGHGLGDGPIQQHAVDLVNAGTTSTGWVQVANLTDDARQDYAVGKIVEVIREGAGNMSGMSSTITIDDAWAIAAYVRVLQAQASSPSTVAAAEVTE